MAGRPDLRDGNETGRAPIAAPGPGHPDYYRWVVCGLLFAVTAINYTDRQILALLKPQLDRQLHWTNEQYGWANAAFQGAYGVGMFAAGYLIDRFGPRLTYAVCVAFWSLAALGHSLAASVRGFVVARIGLGLSDAGNFPAAIKTVTGCFPKQERALAIGLFNAGSNAGAIIAPAMVPWVAAAWGWQATFLLAGSAGFIWILFWLRWYRATPAGPREGTNANRPDAIPWSRLLEFRQTWSFIVAKFVLDPVWWFFLIWLPDYFKQTRGLDIKRSWPELVTIYGLTTALGVAGSWVSGIWIGRGWSVTRARKRAMAIFAACMLAILAVDRLGNWPAVWTLGIACAAFYAYVSNMFCSVADMFPAGSVASVVSLGSVAGCISGMAFPVFCGRVLDSFAARGDVGRGYTLLLAICSVAGLVAFLSSHLLAPSFEPVRQPARA